MNYQHLYYFKVIAEESSISRASERLRLGQPTLSAQLKQFEGQIGRLLFDRTHKRIKLNESGQLVLDYAKRIFALGDELLEALNDRLPNEQIHFQLGVLDSVPKQVVLKIVQMAHQYGPCSVSILEGRGDELMRELSQHRIDLVITNFSPRTGGENKYVVKKFAREPVSIYGTTQFKKVKAGFPKSLMGQAIVMPTYDSQLRLDLEHYFKLTGLRVKMVAETQDTSLQRWIAESGAGLIPSTKAGVQDLVQQKKMIHLGVLEEIFEEYFFVSIPRRLSHPIAQKILESKIEI